MRMSSRHPNNDRRTCAQTYPSVVLRIRALEDGGKRIIIFGPPKVVIWLEVYFDAIVCLGRCKSSTGQCTRVRVRYVPNVVVVQGSARWRDRILLSGASSSFDVTILARERALAFAGGPERFASVRRHPRCADIPYVRSVARCGLRGSLIGRSGGVGLSRACRWVGLLQMSVAPRWSNMQHVASFALAAATPLMERTIGTFWWHLL